MILQEYDSKTFGTARKTHVRVGYSLGDFVSQANAPCANYGERRSRCKDPWERSWFGRVSYDEACSMAENGWISDAPRIDLYEGTVDKLMSTVTGASGQGTEDAADWGTTVEGGKGDVDMGAYLDGDPECVVALEPRPFASALQLYVDCTGNCSIAPEAFVERGMVVASLVDLLHRRGVLVEVWVGCRTRSERTYGIWTRLKASTDYLDLPQLTYALCHVSFLRRLTFSAMETEEFRSSIGVIYGGYGTPITSEDDLDAMPEHFYEKSPIAACALLPAITGKESAKRDIGIMDRAGFFASLRKSS